jgi:hypothetical protein
LLCRLLASYSNVRSLFLFQYPQTLNGSKERENSLHSHHLKGTARKTQANLAGVAQGFGETTGSTTSTGNTQDNEAVTGFVSSNASGNFAITSKGFGGVNTNYGGADASGGSSTSGSSIGNVKGYESGYGDVTFSGSSTASGDGDAIGSFGGPSQQSPTGAVQASGFGTGTLNVAGSGITGPATGPTLIPGQPYKTAYSSGSGTAKTAAGGSATAFNMLASTGGLGSGMTTGTATGVLDSRSIYAVESASTATGTFNGSGLGNYGNTLSQPYTSGFVGNGGGGGGTASVKGAVTGFTSYYAYYGEYVNTNGEAAFNSNGGGAGFVKGKNGGADGSGSGGASGTVAGIAMDLPPTDKTIGDLDFSAISAANGVGTFFGGFSTPESPGPTGGTGSGNGALSISANSGGGIYNDGLVTSNGSAGSFGGGEASASNVFGTAVGLGSGSTAGSAKSGLQVLSGAGDGTGTSMGNFGTTGSGVFRFP